MARGEVSRFVLTVAELRFVVDRVAELSLPSFLSPGDLEGAQADSDGSDVGDSAVFRSLQAKGVVDEDAEFSDNDLTSVVSPVLVAGLGLHNLARFFLDVKAWSEAESNRLWVSVSGSLCAGFRVVSDRRPVGGESTQSVEVTLFPLNQLVEFLLEPVSADPVRVVPASAVVGLVESRSIIEALRRGEPAVAASIAQTFHCEDAVPLLSELVGSMEHGFKVLLFNHEGRAIFSADWFRGEGGWLKMGLVAPPGGESLSARSLADNGRISVTRAGVDFLRADLLSMVVSLAEVPDAA